MKNLYRILLVAVLSLTTLVTTAASFTSFVLKATVDGETENIDLPLSGFPIETIGGSVGSFVLNGFATEVDESVRGVALCYAIYPKNTLNTPSFKNIQASKANTYRWEAKGVDLDLLSGLTEGTTYVLEFYLLGIDSSNEAFACNNGGDDFKVVFTYNKPVLSFNNGLTAGLSLQTDNDIMYKFLINGDCSYTPDGKLGEISTLTILGAYVDVEHKANLLLTGSLQYKVYKEGEGGPWNGIPMTRTMNGTTASTFSATDVNVDVDLSSLTDGEDYVLEVTYQLINGSEYYFLGREPAIKFTFTKKGKEVDPNYNAKYDVNDDGGINIADVNIILNWILQHQ